MCGWSGSQLEEVVFSWSGLLVRSENGVDYLNFFGVGYRFFFGVDNLAFFGVGYKPFPLKHVLAQ